jgi:hypothetical protein
LGVVKEGGVDDGGGVDDSGLEELGGGLGHVIWPRKNNTMNSLMRKIDKLFRGTSYS